MIILAEVYDSHRSPKGLHHSPKEVRMIFSVFCQEIEMGAKSDG